MLLQHQTHEDIILGKTEENHKPTQLSCIRCGPQKNVMNYAALKMLCYTCEYFKKYSEACSTCSCCPNINETLFLLADLSRVLSHFIWFCATSWRSLYMYVWESVSRTKVGKLQTTSGSTDAVYQQTITISAQLFTYSEAGKIHISIGYG